MQIIEIKYLWPRAQPGWAKGAEAPPSLSQVKVEKKDNKF